ncbi:hypothetical protein [Streptomyces sp. NPDC001970]
MRGDDLPAGQSGRGPRLPVQARGRRLLARPGEDLDRDGAIEPLVDAAPDLTHPAGAEKPADGDPPDGARGVFDYKAVLRTPTRPYDGITEVLH